MVQIYEDQPSFSQIMGRGLGGAAGSFLSQGLEEYLKNKKETGVSQKFKEQFGIDVPEEGRTEFYKALGKKKAEHEGLGQILKLINSKRKGQDQENAESSPIEPFEEESSLWSSLDPEEKLALEFEYPQVARSMIEEEKIEGKKQANTAEKVDKYLTGVTESQEALRGQLYTIDSAIQAVMEGKEGLSSDFWVDTLGLPSQLKSASGATLDAASKNHILTSLANMGRLNVFLEKQVKDAFALPGGSKKGNLARLELAKTLAEMKQIKNTKALEIADRYENAGKTIPGKINRLVDKEAAPLYEKLQKRSSYKIQDLLEPEAGSEELGTVKQVSKGTPLTQKKFEALFARTFPKKDISTASEEDFLKVENLAKGLGYDINIFALMEQE